MEIKVKSEKNKKETERDFDSTPTASYLNVLRPLTVNVKLALRVCVRRVRPVLGCAGASQLFGGGRQVLGELGEAQVGAVHHVGLTAALGGTHGFAVTLVAQTPVARTWTPSTHDAISTR